MLRSAGLCGRLCIREVRPQVRVNLRVQQNALHRQLHINKRHNGQIGFFLRTPTRRRGLLFCALSPLAFVKLSEEDKGDGETGEVGHQAEQVFQC